MEEDFVGCVLEYDTVERTVIVAVDLMEGETRVRIDVLRSRTGSHSTQASVEREVRLSDDEGGDAVRAWVAYDLPLAHGDTAEATLPGALSFLAERCHQK